MTQERDIDGPTIVRDDGSTVHVVAYKDGSGNLLGKAYVPEGHSPSVPDDVSETVVIDDSTTLSDHLPSGAIGNIPDPAETAMEKLEKLDVPDDSPM